MSTVIIAGTLRGRKINVGKINPKHDLRPILARIRKSLFDIMMKKLPGCMFLDLYAGSGTVGIEAISRGAKKVIFVDFDRNCISQIENVLKEFGVAQCGKAVRGDVIGDLVFLKDVVPEPFDIIFMGPPYKELLVSKTLDNIMKAKILGDNGWVLAQHQKKEIINVPEGLEMFRQEKYGDTLVSFFKHSLAVSPPAPSS